MAFLTWLGGLFKKGSPVGGTAPASNPTSLPSLPTGSVAAVADAVTEAGRIVEQQTTLHNTAAMQQSAIAAQQSLRQDKVEQDISNEDVNATRNDLAD